MSDDIRIGGDNLGIPVATVKTGSTITWPKARPWMLLITPPDGRPYWLNTITSEMRAVVEEDL